MNSEAKHARAGLKDDTAKDDEGEETEPYRRNRRLGRLLGALLDLILGFAHAGLVVLGELCVCASLLGCLRHCECV